MFDAVCNGLTRVEHVKVKQIEGVVLVQWVEWGQVRVEQVVEVFGVVRVVGMEVVGWQTEGVVSGQLMMEKARQVGMMLGAVARPRQ